MKTREAATTPNNRSYCTVKEMFCEVSLRDELKKMILTLAWRSERLSHVHLKNFSGVFNGIWTHDLFITLHWHCEGHGFEPCWRHLKDCQVHIWDNRWECEHHFSNLVIVKPVILLVWVLSQSCSVQITSSTWLQSQRQRSKHCHTFERKIKSYLKEKVDKVTKIEFFSREC